VGSIFRRSSTICTTCNERLQTTAAKTRHESAGHKLKERVAPVWWIGYKTKDGWKYESSKSTAKVDAQRLLRDKEGAIDRGQHAGRWTFEEAKKAVLLDYKVNKRRSLDVFERRIVKHLEPVFAGWELADITTTVLRDFQSKRQEAGASNAEINRELDAVSKMFKLAIQDGKLFAKPYIPKLREASAKKGFVTDEEYTAIHEKLEPHMRHVWAFQYLTGWRSTEVLALRWEHVNAKEIRFLGQTKADEAARPFPIIKPLKRVLDEQRKLTAHLKSPHVFVFVKGKKMAGRPISYMGYLHAFNDARAAAKARPDLIPHDCRRTAIDRMERLGIARSTAMVMVGHKTESVYRRYAITSPKTLEDAGSKLEAVKLPKTQ
jgi:integrase